MCKCNCCGMNEDEVVGQIEITHRLSDGTVLRMCAECQHPEERKANANMER